MFFNQYSKNELYKFYIIKSDNIKITLIYGEKNPAIFSLITNQFRTDYAGKIM